MRQMNQLKNNLSKVCCTHHLTKLFKCDVFNSHDEPIYFNSREILSFNERVSVRYKYNCMCQLKIYVIHQMHAL